MEEQVRSIVAGFLKRAPEEINAGTAIDRTALGSSIVLHRMYGKLAEIGAQPGDYSAIATFGQLLSQLNGGAVAIADASPPVAAPVSYSNTSNGSSIGVDIQDVAALPKADDFREDSFYTANFSAEEISYCILQNDPYASFAGLFAAKEAIVKADNRLRSLQFNRIVITRDDNGKPLYSGIQLSVSHTKDNAVAAAVKIDIPSPPPPQTVSAKQSRNGMAAVAVLLSLISLALAIAAYATR